MNEVIRGFSPAIVIIFVIDFCLICYLVSCFKKNKNWSKLYKAEDILIIVFVIIAIWLGNAYVNSRGWDQFGYFVCLLYSLVITANLVLVYIVSKFVHYLKRRKRRKRK